MCDARCNFVILLELFIFRRLHLGKPLIEPVVHVLHLLLQLLLQLIELTISVALDCLLHLQVVVLELIKS